MINQFGQDGTVCVDGWDEREANVTCRQFGYRGGVVLGPQEVFTRRQPVWFSEFNCTGEESKLQDCPRTTKVSLQCVRSIKDAGVLCYNSTGRWVFFFILIYQKLFFTHHPQICLLKELLERMNHALSPQEPVKKTSNLQKIGPHKFLIPQLY